MRRARPLLGTFVEVEAIGAAEPALERAIALAFDAIERVHCLMSFHDPDSDLSRLNRHAASEPVTVDPWTFKVLDRARMLFEAAAAATMHKGDLKAPARPAAVPLFADDAAYSVVAPTCLLADALTKVLVQLTNPDASYFARFGAQAFVTSAGAINGKAA